MIGAFLQVAAGIALFALGKPLAKRIAERRAARLDVLQSGGDEHFFEELRSLKAYPPGQWEVGRYRLAGIALIILGVINLLR
ncbi:hypothetical protein [Novosphingobium sp. MMS21-SN21R]|uniref:hypothetical protein n=1 Tax=Novosphingobium sp. MMS21-SN21R TaxID=2969298 RepID=UPI0028889CC4|nr:hypothetical protein [Novosphingobium sp. MMS21-SN21R]MDT0508862.1 hypothetical protein [Novosphingobium sp. MMS21-SN21R]